MGDSQEINKLKDYVDDKLKQMNHRIDSDFDMIKGKINEIVTEFNKLEDAIKRLNNQAKQQAQAPQQPQQSQESAPANSASGHPAEGSTFNPKTGRTKNEDVAIDKIFYYGHKR